MQGEKILCHLKVSKLILQQNYIFFYEVVEEMCPVVKSYLLQFLDSTISCNIP